MIAYICKYTKSHRIVYIKWVNRMVYELDLNKAYKYKFSCISRPLGSCSFGETHLTLEILGVMDQIHSGTCLPLPHSRAMKSRSSFCTLNIMTKVKESFNTKYWQQCREAGTVTLLNSFTFCGSVNRHNPFTIKTAYTHSLSPSNFISWYLLNRNANTKYVLECF